VKIEEPLTHRDLTHALTQKEQQLGIEKIRQRKALSPKDAGKKWYEVALFDLATHRYITDQ